MNSRRISTLAACATAAILWVSACDGGTEPPPPDPPRPTTVTVTPSAAELAALEATVQLTAEVRDQYGDVMAGASVSWLSSDGAVAAVDGSGLVTAAGNGAATITATSGQASGTAAVTVAQVVAAVAVTPEAHTLVEADTLRFSAEAADANGHAVGAAEFLWSTGDTLVAVVDDSGLVTGVAPGVAEVTATTSGVSGAAVLTVAAAVPTTVAVTPDTVAFTAIGQTAQLSAEVRDQIGRVMEDAAVSWSSSDTAVAAVDEGGVVRSGGGGVVTITAVAGEASGAGVVTVTQVASSVVVSPAAATISMGDTLQLAAEAFDANGYTVGGAEFSWSSSDGAVAEVGGGGVVRGITEGTVTITATAGDAQGTSEITVENPDRAALVALYRATDGPYWVNNENWLTDAPLSDWYGVRTDDSGRVVGLILAGTWDYEAQATIPHGLAGAIPPELGRLTSLEVLNFRHNRLTGPIPPELGDLAKLESLWLSRNSLTGPIPAELAGLAQLESLSLGWNSLTGPIPPELAGLANLEFLDFWSNSLTGPVPPELGNLANLESLGLASNALTGPIPPELGNLANLEGLALDRNALTGPIPAELGDLTNLRSLTLSSNSLTGSIPAKLGDLPNLGWLWLGDNNLTGVIPRTFLNLSASLFSYNCGELGVCMPGNADFVAWLDGKQVSGPMCNADDVAALEQLYDAGGGSGWSRSDGWLSDEAVGEWYGVKADSLGRVRELDLTRNELAGQLPPAVGNLTRMTVLRIGGNALAGRLPRSLVRVPLREFLYPDTELCAPTEASFQEWLGSVESYEGTGVNCQPLSERDILESLYYGTGGGGWTNSGNWGTGAPVGDWHGVTVDDQGRVISLGLDNNGLAGPIPPDLGDLAYLRELSLASNGLTGRIPPELGTLSDLEILNLRFNALTGPIPSELGDLLNLEILDLVFNELSGPIPPELGRLANLERLSLWWNDLSGTIPPELGSLGNLKYLTLGLNALTGPIPSELGDLGNLGQLSIHRNKLTGPIPPELGDLGNLWGLQLEHNELSGSIPAELGNLGNLSSLTLGFNALTGPIPPQLGGLTRLTELKLASNGLTGSLPPELGGLADLQYLYVDHNELSGAVPRGLGALSSLQALGLAANSGMAGPLPADLTKLSQLDTLYAGGTDLCAPSDPEFSVWLGGVAQRWIKPCLDGSAPAAYLVQAVQSREYPVPLVADEEALLRVFVTARQTTVAGIPPVRATFYVNGRETHVANIPGKPTPIPTEVDESKLSKSVNAPIPGHVVRPGLEMVIDIDPDGTLDPELGVPKRIPETGRLAVEVAEMPGLDLTLIPFVWAQTQDSSVVDLVEAMAEDPENHELLWATRTLLPIGDLDVTAHEPVLSASNDVNELLSQTEAIRVIEGGTGHYYGLVNRPVPGSLGGVAIQSGRSSASLPEPDFIAHELGHNMNLQHAPCWTPAGDPSYPYPDGSIGAWGYDFRDGGSLVHSTRPDIMSYCLGQWVSDYHFTNALRYRLLDEGPAASAIATRSILLWGGVGTDSLPYLEPAFLVDARAALPASAGAYRIDGRTASGAELFSLSFAMPEVGDAEGGATSFVFALPIQAGWEDNLASITLSGPEGSVTLDESTDRPMAILRDPRTGQVRAFLSDLPAAIEAAVDAVEGVAGQGVEVLFSRGIPSAEAWRR